MHNPWKELPIEPPYVLHVLRGDLRAITTFNDRRQPNKRIEIEVGSIPEPFIGNPESATVVLLNGNPGHDVRDCEAHMNNSFRAALRRNLQREKQDYPFFPLNPAFSWTPCAKWWYKHLRELFDVGELAQFEVAQRLCVIERFPYHSLNGKNLPQNYVVPSQKYSSEIAAQALKEDKLVVGMRAKTRWARVDKRLGKVPYLEKSPKPRNQPREWRKSFWANCECPTLTDIRQLSGYGVDALRSHPPESHTRAPLHIPHAQTGSWCGRCGSRDAGTPSRRAGCAR